MNPRVSIITPSLDQDSFVEETIRSVLSQGYPDIEHIIVDGGSADNTIEILKAFGDRITWISEPDRGQADAVNKGFRLAKGDILGWLNSDDTYNPGAVTTAVEFFDRHPEVVMVYGDAYYIDRDGKVLGRYSTEPFRFERLAESCFICQPSVFIRAEAVKRIGELDVSLQLCMDYDYWIRVGKQYPPTMIRYLQGKYLANSRMHGDTKTVTMEEGHYLECLETVKRHFGSVPPAWTCAYMNVVGVKEQMRRHEKRNIVARALVRVFYVTKKYGWRWGWRSFVISCEEGIKYFKRKRGGMI